jgi:ATP-dependent Lon protease
MSKRPRRNSENLDNSDNFDKLDELERELEDKERERKGKGESNFEEQFDDRCHMYNLDDDDINLSNNNKKDNKEIKSLYNKIKLELYDKTVTIDHILKLKNINQTDRVKLVEKYCIMKSQENNLEEYIKYRDILKEEITKIENMTFDQIRNKDKLDLMVRKLESINKISTDLKEKIIQSDLEDEYKSILYGKYKSLEDMTDKDSEYFKIKNWILLILSIPFKRKVDLQITNSNQFLKHIKIQLDHELYGMKNVKEELMLQIINRFIKNRKSEQILSLVGSAGVGKTKIIHTMAKSLNLPFHHISLGGIKDGSFLDGFSGTYIGSKQGVIVDALVKMNCCNGIIFFDEIDKISETMEGIEVVNQLIHILDHTQNNVFYDKYVSEIPIDLSNIWFICSLNNIDIINPILRNRLCVIDVEGYGTIQKVDISKNIIIPKKCKDYCLENQVQIDDSTIEYIVSKCRKSDKGIRELKRNIDTIFKRIDILRTSIDSDGNYGVLDWSFKIENLKFPIKLTKKHIDVLLNDVKNGNESQFV